MYTPWLVDYTQNPAWSHHELTADRGPHSQQVVGIHKKCEAYVILVFHPPNLTLSRVLCLGPWMNRYGSNLILNLLSPGWRSFDFKGVIFKGIMGITSVSISSL